jgi:hypothetical protein
MGHKFHPWEGGEGKVTSQYLYCHVELGKKYIKEGNFMRLLKCSMQLKYTHP